MSPRFVNVGPASDDAIVEAINEIKSIRRALGLLASVVAFNECEVSSIDILRRCGLSESVIDWAITPTVNP